MEWFALNSVEKSPASALQQMWISLLADFKMILLGFVAVRYRNISIEISVTSTGTGESNFQAEVSSSVRPSDTVVRGSQPRRPDESSCRSAACCQCLAPQDLSARTGAAGLRIPLPALGPGCM